MAPRNRLHILLRDPALAESYTSYATGRGSARPPAPIRDVHFRRLIEEAERAERDAAPRRQAAVQDVGVQPVTDGLLLTFASWPGFQLELTTFDPARQPPELLAVRDSVDGGQIVQLATVYVPQGSLSYFLRRFERYGTENTASGKPVLANMVERIAGLRLATLEALWTESGDLFPPHDEVVWWELWLRRSDGQELDRVRSFVSLLGIEVGARQLVFDSRIIVDVRATADQLSSALDVIDDFAELRFAHTPTTFFAGLLPAEQALWVDDLLARTEFVEGDEPAACIFDTGRQPRSSAFEAVANRRGHAQL